MKQARHQLYYNSYWYFNQHCLCLYFHVVAQLFQLWFNFTPLHLIEPFGLNQSLQLLLRQYLCKVIQVLSSTLLPRLLWHGLYNYYGLICHLHSNNKSLSFNLFLLSLLKKRQKIEASLVKLTFLFAKPSVKTCKSIQTLSIGTFCNLTPNTCQNRFTLYYVPQTY